MTVRVVMIGEVKEGMREEFFAFVEEFTAVLREADGDKTPVYDFYVADDAGGTNFALHEGYRTPEDLLAHVRNATPYTPRLFKYLRTTEIQFFGPVPDEIIEGFKGRAKVTTLPTFVGSV
ncbi:hypothetical protein MNQ96_08305 [Sphingopyxis granuli]|uniref:hypothetical protein n=1 Tax=Sphingopyxis granuli TaxID=267128 RepID=UPI001F53068C|nr:hypothetical protein [Sphingopyxis granuli]UNK81053.1 hypothetical protein MNQ96_08305 [Sphingopyxis granuli]